MMKIKARSNESRHEDFAIEEFCKILSLVEECDVHIISRPDNRGRTGERKCDAIIIRGGTQFTLEHTSLMTYGAQKGKKRKKEHDILISRHIVPLRVKEAILAHYPDFWVHIDIPVSAFDIRHDFELTFKRLKGELIRAVGETPVSRHIEERKEYKFDGIPFSVWISRGQSDEPQCFINCFVSTNDKERLDHLEQEVERAIARKRSKLNDVKQEGESTILLLDSDDISFVNLRILARAFGNTAPRANLEGIDEVFVMHALKGGCVTSPVKIGENLYPNLPEFQEYIKRQSSRRP